MKTEESREAWNKGKLIGRAMRRMNRSLTTQFAGDQRPHIEDFIGVPARDTLTVSSVFCTDYAPNACLAQTPSWRTLPVPMAVSAHAS